MNMPVGNEMVWSWGALMPILPELFLVAVAMVLLVWGAFRANGIGHMRATNFAGWFAAGAFICAAILMIGVPWGRAAILNNMFVMDPFAGVMKILILIGMAGTMAASVRYLVDERIARFEYPVLMLLATVGMMLMVSSHNMLALYVGLEMMSLSLYVLAAIRRDHARAAEAGLKYFVLGALASGMMLFGISLLYGFTGTLGFDGIAAAVATDSTQQMAVLVGMVFVLAGVAFKISAAPFHMWTPDVYEGAPTSVTAMFAVAPKIAAIALLVRLLFGPFAEIMGDWQEIIWFLAFASLLVGSFAALAQSNIKRLMAYSSIGNVGYALIGIVAGTVDGIGAVIVYLTIYMVMTVGVFAVILTMRRDGMEVERIDDLAGLSRYRPALAYAMAILMFSMSGIPPMAGFFGKLVVFQAAVSAGFYVLAVLGVLASVVAAYYYLRVIKVMFFDQASAPMDVQVGAARKLVLGLSVLFVMLYIVKPNALISMGRDTAESLLQPSSVVMGAVQAEPVTQEETVFDEFIEWFEHDGD